MSEKSESERANKIALTAAEFQPVESLRTFFRSTKVRSVVNQYCLRNIMQLGDDCKNWIRVEMNEAPEGTFHKDDEQAVCYSHLGELFWFSFSRLSMFLDHSAAQSSSFRESCPEQVGCDQVAIPRTNALWNDLLAILLGQQNICLSEEEICSEDRLITLCFTIEAGSDQEEVKVHLSGDAAARLVAYLRQELRRRVYLQRLNALSIECALSFEWMDPSLYLFSGIGVGDCLSLDNESTGEKYPRIQLVLKNSNCTSRGRIALRERRIDLRLEPGSRPGLLKTVIIGESNTRSELR